MEGGPSFAGTSFCGSVPPALSQHDSHFGNALVESVHARSGAAHRINANVDLIQTHPAGAPADAADMHIGNVLAPPTFV